VSEVDSRPSNAWLNYRLAWALNRLDLPDSALAFAENAWSLEPARERYLSEFMKSLSMLGMDSEILGLARYLRGGGVGRYYAAAAGDSASLAYLAETAAEGGDSAAADACCWLSILCFSSCGAESSIALLERSVFLEPGDPFYRSLLVQRLAASGRLDRAIEHLDLLRRTRARDAVYWQAAASVAEAEGDDVRLAWALRRCWQARQTSEAGRDLGWALYTGAGRAVSEGEIELARQWLTEARGLHADSVVTLRSDSLLRLLDEFEKEAGRW
jgi:tetratricopeptide (TPR) repeat protein